jgi:hypothetical protein
MPTSSKSQSPRRSGSPKLGSAMNPRRSSRSKSCSPQVRCRSGSNFNIEWQFSIFGGYRNTFGKILIHVFFVWPTILGVMTLLAYTKKFAASPPIFAEVPHNLGHYMQLNGSFIMAVVYSLFYIEMNLVVGTLAMFLLVACWIASNMLVAYRGASRTAAHPLLTVFSKHMSWPPSLSCLRYILDFPSPCFWHHG